MNYFVFVITLILSFLWLWKTLVSIYTLSEWWIALWIVMLLVNGIMCIISYFAIKNA